MPPVRSSSSAPKYQDTAYSCGQFWTVILHYSDRQMMTLQHPHEDVDPSLTVIGTYAGDELAQLRVLFDLKVMLVLGH